AKREALASLASLALLALLTAAWQRLPSPDIPVPSVAPAGCRHLCSRSEDDPEVGDVADGAVAADAGGGAGTVEQVAAARSGVAADGGSGPRQAHGGKRRVRDAAAIVGGRVAGQQAAANRDRPRSCGDDAAAVVAGRVVQQ